MHNLHEEGFQHESTASRSISSDPLDVRKLMEELKIPDKPARYEDITEDSDEDIKPVVMKAVKVWRAQKIRNINAEL